MTPIRPSGIGDGIAIIPEPSAPGTSPGTRPGEFAEALSHAIGSVDQLQVAADQQASALADGHGNLHETSIALAKAEVGFHLMTKIRDRVVDAYQDIMKMSM
jgi:flagellar hook-basal body complex protein FliE